MILEPKLIPFAQRLEANLQLGEKILVQEDNAPSHAHRYQHKVYELYDILRLIWPPNSPDLNMIEPCWYWMKKQTTKKGIATSKADLEAQWRKCWKELPLEKIQAWIERIPVHIKRIIELEGGNEYKEGRGRTRNPDRVRS